MVNKSKTKPPGRTKFDWAHWRKLFVAGDDTVTLKWLSGQPGAPSYDAFRAKAKTSAENWEEQRQKYRQHLSNMAATTPEAQAAVDQVARIVDTAEMLTQHNQIARLLIAKGVEGVRALESKHLKGSELLAYLKAGIEIQRLTEGLATKRQEINLTNIQDLSDKELERIVAGDGDC
jgi:ABC-type Fe2+-enterobactin transport system substrate-binding protein